MDPKRRTFNYSSLCSCINQVWTSKRAQATQWRTCLHLCHTGFKDALSDGQKKQHLHFLFYAVLHMEIFQATFCGRRTTWLRHRCEVKSFDVRFLFLYVFFKLVWCPPSSRQSVFIQNTAYLTFFSEIEPQRRSHGFCLYCAISTSWIWVSIEKKHIF